MTEKPTAKRFWNALESLPVLIPGALAVFSVVLVVLLLAGQFNNTSILILSLVTVVPAGWVLIRNYKAERPGSLSEIRLFDVLILLFVILWAVLNFGYVAKSVFITRDPGFYTLTGKWLTEHETTNISVENHFGTTKGVVAREGGIWNNTGVVDWKSDKQYKHLQPQGVHLFPAILGVAADTGGDSWIFKTNVLIGAVALLALYGFSRLIMRPRWAAIATVTLGASLPLIYFSRDTYTEPLSVVFTFGALSLLWLCYKSLPNLKPWLWLIAGVTAGAGVLTRPDGYFIVVALTGFLFLLGLSIKKSTTKNLLKNASVYFAGAAIPMFIGWLDMTQLSRSYYAGHDQFIVAQLAMLAAVLIGGSTLLFAQHRTKLLTWLYKRVDKLIKGQWAFWLSAIVATGAAILATRPLWLKSVFPKFTTTTGSVMSLQRRLGLPVEPRNYYENSFEWLGWYIGGTLLILAIAGVVAAIYMIINKKRLELLPAALLIGLTSAAFITFPQITPDQIWAMRRFLPVVMPGLIVFGIFAIAVGWERFVPKRTAAYKQHAMYLGIGVFIVLQPLLISRPFLNVTEKSANHKALMNFCQQLPEDAAVLWLDRNTLSQDAVHATRTFCGKPAMAYVRKDKKKNKQIINHQILKRLADEAYSNDKVPVIATHGERRKFVGDFVMDQLRPVSVYKNNFIERTLINPPRKIITKRNSIEAGILKPSGDIVPLTQ